MPVDCCRTVRPVVVRGQQTTSCAHYAYAFSDRSISRKRADSMPEPSCHGCKINVLFLLHLQAMVDRVLLSLHPVCACTLHNCRHDHTLQTFLAMQRTLTMRATTLLAALGLLCSATAQPFQPHAGVAPLGSLRTSDYDGPYNLTMLSAQVRATACIYFSACCVLHSLTQALYRMVSRPGLAWY